MNLCRMVVVDDHAILRDGIVSIFKAQSDFEVVGVADSVASAVEAARNLAPDLMLMDYGLPDGTGLDATRRILSAQPEINIVLLTVHEEDDLLFSAIRSGAKGYLLKNINADDLLSKLRGLYQGNAALSSAQTRRILSEFARTEPAPSTKQVEENPLTARELEVLSLIASGMSNRDIGAQLHISRHTVKNHVHNIIEKLGAKNRREAVRLAVEKGLLL